MTSSGYKKLAKQVADSVRISQKENPGINIAKRKFGSDFIEKILRKKEFSLDSFSKTEQKKIKELMGFVYGPLVYAGTDGKLRAKATAGELARIVYSETDERAVELAKEIRNECWRRGCTVSFIPSNDLDSKLYYKTMPESGLAELPRISEILAKEIDVRIFVGDHEHPDWSMGLEKQLKLTAPSSMRLMQIQDRRKVRWCLLGFPVRMGNEKDYITPVARYEKVYMDSITDTFKPYLKQLCGYYKKALENKKIIRITANDGTDLTFSIKGRPILVADGIIDDADMENGDIGLNIPDGEVFLAPLETTANGKILFDYIRIHGFGLVRDLWVVFKNGKATEFYSENKKYAEKFRRFLDSNTGEKDRIAELGIGTNRAARFIGTTIVDEKIFGTIHIAIGNNTGAYHGKNRASSHLDMIKVMKGKGGNMRADGKLIMKDGMPVGKN
jgi:aminopeptidase